MSRIFVDITHPAHVHFFRNSIMNWEAAGHTVKISARNKDVLQDLLRTFNLPFEPVGKAQRGVSGLARELIMRESVIYRLLGQFKPDVVCAFGGTFIVHAAKLRHIPSIILYDNNAARVANALTFPFATIVATPDAFPDDLGRRHRRFAGYKETAYMHPDYFTPDPTVLERDGIDMSVPFSFIRLSSWEASHDLSGHGFRNMHDAVRRLEKFGRVIINIEGAKPLPPELESMRYRGSAIDIHHYLAFAQLVIGEGATTAAEAAILGTPSLYVSTLPCVTTHDLERRYGLVYSFMDPELGQQQGLEKAEAILSDPQTPHIWQAKRQKMLNEQQDVTQYVTDLVLSYA